MVYFYIIAAESSSPQKKSNKYSGKSSPFARPARSTFHKSTLSYHDVGELQVTLFHPLIDMVLVPIYDATAVNTSFTEVLDNLASLPRLNKDVSNGSCAVVGYSANEWRKGGDPKKRVSFNIQWAILLGED
jgi:hypothetical protein